MSRKLLLSLLSLVGVIAICLGLMPQGTLASSHREAPLISKDPTADNTDLYAFVSPDKPSTVTIIANYIPLEEPAGGPNFNAFDDDALDRSPNHRVPPVHSPSRAAPAGNSPRARRWPPGAQPCRRWRRARP